MDERWLQPSGDLSRPSDLSKPSVGRVYDYLLGGSSNFSVDREFAREVRQVFPGASEFARVNRLLLQRARYLVDRGIRQFLDLGSGFPPSARCTRSPSRSRPSAGVVYVDLEPIAVAQNELVLENNDHATVVRGDLRRPEELLAAPRSAGSSTPASRSGCLCSPRCTSSATTRARTHSSSATAPS